MSSFDTNKQRFDIVLLDADETIFDFKLSEAYALEKTLKHYGVEFTDERLARYSDINLYMWKALERGEISREKLKSERFRVFFEDIAVSISDYNEVNNYYLKSLSETSFMIDGATDFVRKLHHYCKIYITTNGLIIPQTGRLRNSSIENDVDGMFISEEIGFAKPEKAYFEYIFNKLSIKDKSRVIIIGDSLTSDMLGGRNAGITTCHFSRSGELFESDLCDYQITDYDDFFDILFYKDR